METDDLHIRSWGTIGDGYLGPAFHRKFVVGQVLYGSRRTYLRKVAVADFDGVCANTTFVLEPMNGDLIPELLPFIMQTESFVRHSMQQSRGSTNPYVTFKDLAWYEFALPPRDEQRRIAEILWAADEAVERFQDCVEAQNMVKQALLIDNFVPRASTPQISLGEVGRWISGGTPSRANVKFWAGNIPWASPKDMKRDILEETEEYVSSEGANAGSRIVPQGTIFVVVRGMILAHTFPVAIAGRSMAFNQDMKALVASPNFISRYLFYWLQYKSKDILQLVSDSSHGTKRLPTDELFGMKVPVISLESQNKVIKILVQCDEAVSRLKLEILHLSQVKSGLLRKLLQHHTEG